MRTPSTYKQCSCSAWQGWQSVKGLLRTRCSGLWPPVPVPEMASTPSFRSCWGFGYQYRQQRSSVGKSSFRQCWRSYGQCRQQRSSVGKGFNGGSPSCGGPWWWGWRGQGPACGVCVTPQPSPVAAADMAATALLGHQQQSRSLGHGCDPRGCVAMHPASFTCMARTPWELPAKHHGCPKQCHSIRFLFLLLPRSNQSLECPRQLPATLTQGASKTRRKGQRGPVVHGGEGGGWWVLNNVW